MYVREVFSDVKDFIRKMRDITQPRNLKIPDLDKPVCKQRIGTRIRLKVRILENFVALFEYGCSVEDWIFEFELSNPKMTL